MKSIATQIVEALVSSLKQISKGKKIPWLPAGSEQTFNVTPQTITRRLSDIQTPDQMPALYVSSGRNRYRHLLSDVMVASMEIFVAAMVYKDQDPTGLLDSVSDDVLAVISSNPTWNGLARRTRIKANDATSEQEEPSGGSSFDLEIDFIEISAMAPASYDLKELPAGTDTEPIAGQSKTEQVWNALYNAFLTVQDIVWVERASIWPIPPEEIPRAKTSGIWFKDQNEEYTYVGSQQAEKRPSVSVLYVGVDTNPATFPRSVDQHVARMKDVLGRYADLEGRVSTIDIRSIRSNRSEFPVVIVDADLAILYVESWLSA